MSATTIETSSRERKDAHTDADLDDVLLSFSELAEDVYAHAGEHEYGYMNKAVYEAIDLTRDFVEGSDDGQVDRAFSLMHGLIGEHKKSSDPKLQPLVDVVFEECINRMPPEEVWGLIDLLVDASRVGVQEALHPVLLNLIANKIHTEVALDDFREGSAPAYIHLLRIKSLGQLAAYMNGDEQSSLVDAQLERYSRVETPLLRLCARVEIDSVAIDRAFHDEPYDVDEGAIVSKMNPDLRGVYRRQREYDEHFGVVAHDDSASSVHMRVAKDTVAVMGVSDTVVGFQNITSGESMDPYELTPYVNLYEPCILGGIMDETGVDPLSLDLNEQLSLFNFMMTSENHRYERLVDVAKHMPDKDATEFAQAFLSTEFGEDYGEAILDIAEHAAPEQSTKIFATVNSLRHRSHEYAEMFASIDPQFAAQTEKALNERTTDMLVALREVAVNGSLGEDVSPARNTPGHEADGTFDATISSLDEAIEILGNLEKTFTTREKILQAKDLQISRVNEDTSQFTLYRFMSEAEGNMLLYVRPEGGYGYDRTVEYGNYTGVEASVSFVVDPVDPHKLLLPKSKDGVSIRFDREGRAIDEAPNSPDRDPTREDGMVSIDVSSIMGPADSMPVKIGRMVAAGNLIRARREGTPDSLHHNANYFDQQAYGSAKGFAEFADNLIRQVELLRHVNTTRHMAKRAFDRAA